MTRDENHELAIHFWADGTQPDPLHGSMETLSVDDRARPAAAAGSSRSRIYSHIVISLIPCVRGALASAAGGTVWAVCAGDSGRRS
eukprot:COSAG02_NODE_6627_length_3451_cov_1.639320_1_plen_86_part_00